MAAITHTNLFFTQKTHCCQRLLFLQLFVIGERRWFEVEIKKMAALLGGKIAFEAVLASKMRLRRSKINHVIKGEASSLPDEQNAGDPTDDGSACGQRGQLSTLQTQRDCASSRLDHSFKG